jgi:hypothetical protein
MFLSEFLLGLLFDLGDGGDLLWNNGWLPTDHMALYFERQKSSTANAFYFAYPLSRPDFQNGLFLRVLLTKFCKPLKFTSTVPQTKICVVFNPQANYTDWATATDKRILVPDFADREVSSGQHGGTSTDVNLNFSRTEPLHFLSSSSSFILTSLTDTRSKSTATQKMW